MLDVKVMVDDPVGCEEVKEDGVTSAVERGEGDLSREILDISRKAEGD